MAENKNNDNNKNPGGGEKGPGFPFLNNKVMIITLSILVAILLLVIYVSRPNGSAQKSYSEFLTLLNNNEISEVKILDNREIVAKLAQSDEFGRQPAIKVIIPYPDNELMINLKEKGVIVDGGSKSTTFSTLLISVLPWIIFIAIFFWIFRKMQSGGGGKAFSFGRSKARKHDSTKEQITFDDVAGQDEPKFELQEVVEFLKKPEKFIKLGAKIPKGVLLIGNPGTGKTLLAKAVAGESNVAFFHMSGSDFVEMFVGVGASRVRDLFEQGRKNAPCILFIDEIDAVGRTRGAGYGGGNDEREQTLNQLLVEMDGFDTHEGVIIIAATNRPDVLDPALLRPGRFDRQVTVDMPDVREREAILKIHSRKVKLGKDVVLSVIARATPGSSGADLANLVNEAALFAGRQGRTKVKMEDFEEARDKILMGVARRSKVMSAKEKKMTSYHESGHALLHYYLENVDPIHKVTIIPRGRALGVTFSLPEEDIYAHSSGWLKDKIAIMYGGFIAEDLIYKETTTGSGNDIEQATGLARRMVTEWGMSEGLGPIALGGGDEPIFMGKEIARHKDYSDNTAERIDTEMGKILNYALETARKILTKHKEQLILLTEALFERETLDDKEIRELLGFKPLEPKI